MFPFMQRALDLAKTAYANDEVPVGAVIVYRQEVIAQAYNTMHKNNNCLQHAEVEVIQKALMQLRTATLPECDLYVTLEPCCMCAGAIAHARIRRVYFGAYDIKGGFVDNNGCAFNYTLHKPEVYGGILESECSQLLSHFFLQKR